MNIEIIKAAQILRDSKRVLFITGAGLSADSGLPTYRGVSGLYTDKETDDGMPIEEAMSGHMLKKRPEIAWKYIKQIAYACSDASPNEGHRFIADYQSTHPDSWVLTQNIDGFHKAAGSTNVIPIHGDIWKTVCTGCKLVGKFTKEDASPSASLVPFCSCGSVLRPAVVLFGEQLNPLHLEVLDEELAKGFDAVFSVGTTSVFMYISMPFTEQNLMGKDTVEINPGTTPVSEFAKVKLSMKAAEAFGEIRKLYNPLDK